MLVRPEAQEVFPTAAAIVAISMKRNYFGKNEEAAAEAARVEWDGNWKVVWFIG